MVTLLGAGSVQTSAGTVGSWLRVTGDTGAPVVAVGSRTNTLAPADQFNTLMVTFCTEDDHSHMGTAFKSQDFDFLCPRNCPVSKRAKNDEKSLYSIRFL